MSSFQISGKVAIISGAGSGIGLKCAKYLLKNDLKGVTIADLNENNGKKAIDEISAEFGPNRALFVKTDVVSRESYEAAFVATVKQFGSLDIVVNNAGIYNDSIWEKEIQINLNGCINGTLLGVENYLQKHRSGSEGLIVNISSVVGIDPSSDCPVYSATKMAVIGLSMALGHKVHYDRTKVKVVCLCPGLTDTPMFENAENRLLGEPYKEIFLADMFPLEEQTVDELATGFIKVVQIADSGTVWVVEGGKSPMSTQLHREKVVLKNNIFIYVLY